MDLEERIIVQLIKNQMAIMAHLDCGDHQVALRVNVKNSGDLLQEFLMANTEPAS